MKKDRILLDDEELDFVEDLENQNVKIKEVNEAELKKYSSYAKYTNSLNQKKQTTIRFSVSDLAVVKAKAKEIGIGYQNLIQALVHNYAKGQIDLKL